MSRSFNSTRRITDSRHFVRMKDARTRLHTRNFVILVEPNSSGVSRLGVTVSTRVDKRATVRNRIKRVIRESFRALQEKIKGSFDIVIIARKNNKDASSRDVEREIIRAFESAKLLRDDR